MFTGDSRGLTGDIDDVRLFDHALSATELANVYMGAPHDAPTPVTLQLAAPALPPTPAYLTSFVRSAS